MREIRVELNQVIVEVFRQYFSDARATCRSIPILAGTSEQVNAWIVPLDTPDFARSAGDLLIAPRIHTNVPVTDKQATDRYE
jgi:hypothetical protein